ncbi:MAG: hypothetical protein JW820_15965 [Spirochaetales bacterium]|nr:hypothetical protein [Spirochaetales bacterium]
MRGKARNAARGAALGVAVAGVLLLVSCATVTTLSDGELPAELPAPQAALALPGSVSYTVVAGRIEGTYGRPVDYEIYRPSPGEPSGSDLMVFLAHGFLRNLEFMRGWAAHWASYGVPVTVMSLRNSTWFAGRHERNAEDLRLLARTLHQGPVLYAGYSAGGLAAFLATVQEGGPGGRAVTYLGLDPADSDGLAAAAKPGLAVPALFLLAEPSSCNAEGNILEAIPDRPEVRVQRVRFATHCHFESPTDRACEALCGRVEPPEAEEAILARIRSLATAWVLEQAGITP